MSKRSERARVSDHPALSTSSPCRRTTLVGLDGLSDLRRTARSLLSRAGVSSEHAERVLGHAIGGVEGTYNRHPYVEEKAAALKALATLVERVQLPVVGAGGHGAVERRLAVGEAVEGRVAAPATPKTDAGTRTVPLAPELIAALKAWKLKCPKAGEPGALVFPGTGGQVLHHSNMRRTLERVMRDAHVVDQDGSAGAPSDNPTFLAQLTFL
jgi:integrase